MLYFSLAVSALLLLVVNGIVLRGGKPRLGSAMALCASALIVTFLLTLVLLTFNALLVLLAGAACWAAGTRPRWFLLWSSVATVAAYALFSWWVVVPEIREWQRVKEAHPGESLVDRLANEGRARPAAAAPPHALARLSAFETRMQTLAEQERLTEVQRNGYMAWRRNMALERMHAGVVQQFIDSPGFGPARMPAVARPNYVEWQETEDGPPEVPDEHIRQPVPDYTPAEPNADILAIAAPEFVDAHDRNMLGFLDPSDFGVGKDRAHVYVFKPHHFREGAAAPERWRVARLDLIGVLKYYEPRAYVSEHLPAMDELRDAPTRSLDPFEGRAVATLLRGEDVVVQEAGDRMAMLGSIRAVKQCAHCHQVTRGELLGAFSYKLIRK
jgi:hypothetical protein